MLKPRDANGQELDAKFTLEKTNNQLLLTVESRGGSDHGPNRSRNKDYASGMRMHFKRMAQYGMTLFEIQVASSKAMNLPEADRAVIPKGYSLPLQMAAVTDFEKLRLAIGREAAAFQNTSKSTGNNTKKVRLIVHWPEAVGLTQLELERLFIGSAETAIWTEQPTSSEDELRKRVNIARRKSRLMGDQRSSKPKGYKDVKKASGNSSRFVRDPNVIAWILEGAGSICEACGCSAPFLREDGEPFLEVHHVRPLAEGGPDTVDNAIACCPNCHRELHFGRQRNRTRASIIRRIARLRDWPIDKKPTSC